MMHPPTAPRKKGRTTRRFSACPDLPRHELANRAGVRIALRPNGCLETIEAGDLQIPLLRGGAFDGGLHRLYLRIHDASGIHPLCLVGPESTGTLSTDRRRFVWEEQREGYSVRTVLGALPDRTVWGWEVRVETDGSAPVSWDALLVQDVGLAPRWMIEFNESYISHYIDQRALPHPKWGHLLCCRQNQPQPGNRHPWIAFGCFDGSAGYAFDALSFFGTAFKVNRHPEGLLQPVLPNRPCQNESAGIVLQSRRRISRQGSPSSIVFFTRFDTHHPEATGPRDLKRIDFEKALRAALVPGKAAPLPLHRAWCATRPVLSPNAWGLRELKRFSGPSLHHLEGSPTEPLSCFDPKGRHIVLSRKEWESWRRSGHILRAGPDAMPGEGTLSATSWMDGVFLSHLARGNGNFHLLLSLVRDTLGVIREGGLRMMVEHKGSWHWMGVPSACEFDLDRVRWIYDLKDGTLVVTARSEGSLPQIVLSVKATGPARRFLILADLAPGVRDSDRPCKAKFDATRGRIQLLPKGSRGIEVAFHPSAKIEDWGGGELLGENPRFPRMVIRTRPSKAFRISFSGPKGESTDDFWTPLQPVPEFTTPSRPETGKVLRDTLRWFTHNAIIHFSVLRGLEQYSGAAWGTRDVAQGPLELMLAADRRDIAREIIRRLFSNQHADIGDWPQWFMFPPHEDIRAGDSHGDVIFWPLKAFCDYVEETNDLAILDEPLPFAERRTGKPSAKAIPLRDHLDLALQTIQSRFFPGTALPRYGEGDWNDSMQPARSDLKERMISCWTSALACQTLRRMTLVWEKAGRTDEAFHLKSLCDRISDDIHRHAMPGGVLAGFLLSPDGDARFDPLLHPDDKLTGIRHRLLPINRTVIAEILTPKEAARHLALIRKHLLFPDGTRLMSPPIAYRGGLKTVFQRLESSASWCREIGLQYVHAHLRYAEALAMLGKADELLDALLKVTPVGLPGRLPKTDLRQGNAYFSSSDPGFDDRPSGERNWNRLKQGKVPFRGGWRIYSSGPGIFCNLVVRHLCGLRRWYDLMIFDPVLPRRMNGLTMTVRHKGKTLDVRYRVTGSGHVKRIRVNGKPLLPLSPRENAYRSTGVSCPMKAFDGLLTRRRNLVEIRL